MSKFVSVVAALAALSFCANAAQANDAAVGEQYAKKKCAVCHTWEEGGKNKVGPNLWGSFGRAAGTIDGFKYSEDFRAASGKIGSWDAANLAEYLANPSAYIQTVTGNGGAKSKMTVKVTKEEDIANVIAYLQTLKN